MPDLSTEIDLVALDLPHGPEFVTALQQQWALGRAVLPIDQRLPVAAKQRLLSALRPTHVVGPDEDDRRGRSLRDGVPTLSTDALVIATSGTTGAPKGVVLTHRAVLASAQATNERLAIDENDRWVACLPFAHIGGLSVITRALAANTPFEVLPPEPEALAAAAARGATRVSLVATLVRRIDPTPWRTLLLGGSAMPPDLPPNAVRTYGMTETGSGVVYDGNPLRTVEIDAIGGELRIRGPMLLRAYRTGADGAAIASPEGIDPRMDGWFSTGDAGSVTARADGQVTVRVEGRIGDMIVTGGEKVWPEPVERVLASLDGIRDVAITSWPDPEWGRRVVAVAVVDTSRESLDSLLRRMREHVGAQLPMYCAPKTVVVVNAIERTALGKVVRPALPQRA